MLKSIIIFFFFFFTFVSFILYYEFVRNYLKLREFYFVIQEVLRLGLKVLQFLSAKKRIVSNNFKISKSFEKVVD